MDMNTPIEVDNSTDKHERKVLIESGLLPNPNDVCCAAGWSGLPNDQTRLEAELSSLAVRLARDLERSEEGRNLAIAEGYELRAQVHKLATALNYLRLNNDLSEPQREMVRHLTEGDG